MKRRILLLTAILILCMIPAVCLSANGEIPTLKFGDQLTVTGVSDAEEGGYWYCVELPDGTSGYILSTSILTEPMAESAAYIGNRKSGVFHRPTCQNLPSSRNSIPLDSREQAIKEGYRPCGNCKP